MTVDAIAGGRPSAQALDRRSEPRDPPPATPPLARLDHRGGHGSGRTRPGRRPRAGDDGTVTAETAVTIPSLIVLLVLFVWVLLVITAQLRVVDAARAGARAAARGESFAQSAAIAERAAPARAEASVIRSGDDVRVAVWVSVDPPGGIPVLPSINVHAVAYAAAEETVGEDP